MFLFFFFQAEDGIRDVAVTGVQTCALPICDLVGVPVLELLEELLEHLDDRALVVDDQDPLGHARSITRGGGAGRSRARERRGIAGRVCRLHVMYRGRKSIAILIPTRNAT